MRNNKGSAFATVEPPSSEDDGDTENRSRASWSRYGKLIKWKVFLGAFVPEGWFEGTDC